MSTGTSDVWCTVRPRPLVFRSYSVPKMDKELCETPFTGRKLEKLLLTALSKGKHGQPTPLNGLRLVNVDAKLMGIQGYISKVLQIQLKWSHRDMAAAVSAPESIIVKCPTSVNLQRMFDKLFEGAGEQAPDVSAQVRELHNDEIAIYEFLYSVGEDHEYLDVPIPRCFGGLTIEDGQPCSEGVLIMEDMTKYGNVMKTLGANLSQTQVENLITTLARLHAWSYIRWSGKENSHEVPSIQDRLTRWTQLFCSVSTDVINQCKTEYPEIFGDAPEQKLLDLFSPDNFQKLFGAHAHDGTLPMVLVHGDMQPMNIFFTSEDEGSRLVGLIDWQLSHKGYGTEDLARLLTICTSNEFKRKRGDEILRRYVEAFNARIEETALQPIKYENVKSVFTQMYAFMAMTFAMSARVSDQIVEAVEDAQEKARVKKEYIQHCAELYRDAVETLGW